MFNVGGGEMLVIVLLALLVLGPERLPKAMGQAGRALAQLRRYSAGFQDEIRRAMDPDDAPFRPGEERLAGPTGPDGGSPDGDDEERVVNPAPSAAADGEVPGATGVEGGGDGAGGAGSGPEAEGDDGGEVPGGPGIGSVGGRGAGAGAGGGGAGGADVGPEGGIGDGDARAAG